MSTPSPSLPFASRPSGGLASCVDRQRETDPASDSATAAPATAEGE
jgi:hypothetical protein